MIEQALYHLLATDPQINAVANDRVFPDVVPQADGANDDSLPAVLIAKISDVPTVSPQGASGLHQSRFQITAICNEHHKAAQLAEKITNCLDLYTGTLHGVTIQRIFYQNSVDVPRIDPDSGIQSAMARRIDFLVWFVNC